MGNVSLKVLKFLFKKGYELCLYLAQHLSASDFICCYNLKLIIMQYVEL